MASCLTGAAYTMLADVMNQTVTFDPNTNETLREWTKTKTIKCLAIPYLDGGIRGMGSYEVFAEKYNNYDYARLKSATSLSKRDRVTNIRDARSGLVLWFEEENDNSATVFNVDGSAPVVNPLTGRPSEWIMSLSRSEVRN